MQVLTAGVDAIGAATGADVAAEAPAGAGRATTAADEAPIGGSKVCNAYAVNKVAECRVQYPIAVAEARSALLRASSAAAHPDVANFLA